MISTLLLAAYTLGCPSNTTVPYDIPHTWEVEYKDGIIFPYNTTSWTLTFEERLYIPLRFRCSVSSGNWSPWSRWIFPEPFPGDTNLDCFVGGLDWLSVMKNFGKSCSQ